jgi:hypothetical protein
VHIGHFPHFHYLFQVADALVTWPQLLNNANRSQSGHESIIGMDDDDEDDNSENEDELLGPVGAPIGASVSISAGSPFDNLRDLCCHNAHLTVFANYVISNSDPACLVKIYDFPYTLRLLALMPLLYLCSEAFL